MKPPRTLLLALLIPLLLDLLVFFAVVPSLDKGDGTCFRQQAGEVCEVLSESEIEELLEEESDFFSQIPAFARQSACYPEFGCSGRIVLTPATASALLASGWTMPLRI